MLPGIYNFDVRNAPDRFKAVGAVLLLSLCFFGVFSVGLTQLIHRTHLAAVAHSCAPTVKRKILQREVLRSDFLKDYDVIMVGDAGFINRVEGQVPTSQKVLKLRYNTTTVREISTLARSLRWMNADIIIAQAPIKIWRPEFSNAQAPIFDFWKLIEKENSIKFIDYPRLKLVFDDAPNCLSAKRKVLTDRGLYKRKVQPGTKFAPEKLNNIVKADMNQFLKHPNVKPRKIVFALQPLEMVRTDDKKLLEDYKSWMSSNKKVAGVGQKITETQISSLFE